MRSTQLPPDLSVLLRRGVAEVIQEEELIVLLHSGRPLRLKQGFDPSFPDIHLGHAVGLRKLRQFQELGHQVILIVGDWTAQIGDPSGQSKTRPMLSPEEVRLNAETYMRQFFKIVDRSRTQVRWQSEWYGEFNLGDVLRLTSRFTLAQMLAREDFAKRQAAGNPIALTELLYPLLQAYDSVTIEADVEFGGTDQKFNCLVGRELQGMMGQPPQQVFLVPLLVGTDGAQKMSKSLGNYIAIEEPPQEMYGKVMSLSDDLTLVYFELVTDVSEKELEGFGRQMAEASVNPMLLKKRLAYEIVAQFHGRDKAQEAQEEFERVFQRREAPTKVRTVTLRVRVMEGEQRVKLDGDFNIDDILLDAGVVRSHREAKWLLSQGAIDVDGKKIRSTSVFLQEGSIIKVGQDVEYRFPLENGDSLNLKREGSIIKVGKHRDSFKIRIVEAD